MSKAKKYSPEVRERAVRLVQEHRGQDSSLWAAIESMPTPVQPYRSARLTLGLCPD